VGPLINWRLLFGFFFLTNQHRKGAMDPQEAAWQLQEVDATFVRALEAASSILKRVRSFGDTMEAVSAQVRVWCDVFDHVERVGVASSKHSNDQQLLRRTVVKKAKVKANNSSRSKDTGKDTDSSDISSQNPPTPTLPVFSKSFAKTPMGRRLGEESNLESSDSMLAFSTPRQVTSQNSDDQPRIMDLSDISAATPNTPEDGNFGPPSSVKLRQLMQYATPLTQHEETTGKGDVLLSNEKNNNISRASSNPLTPQLNSPFATKLSMLNSSSGNSENVVTKNQENSQQQCSTGKRKAEEEVPLDVYAGTPISRSIAKKRKRSLMEFTAQSRKDSALTSISPSQVGKQTREEEHGRDEASNLSDDFDPVLCELADVLDEPPPKFNLQLFPKLFQTGEGAAQLTSVYSQFSSHEAFCLAELAKKLPSAPHERLELMLDMLVARGLLRPFTLDNNLYWRAPHANEF